MSNGDAGQANLALVQRMYECFNRDDMDTIRNEIFARDLVWNLPGHHPLSGTKHGARKYWRSSPRCAGPIFRSPSTRRTTRPPASTASARSTVVEVHRGRGTTTVRDASGVDQQVTLNALNCTHYQIRDGRIANVQVYMSDQHAADTFFNAVYQLKPIRIGSPNSR